MLLFSIPQITDIILFKAHGAEWFYNYENLVLLLIHTNAECNENSIIIIRLNYLQLHWRWYFSWMRVYTSGINQMYWKQTEGCLIQIERAVQQRRIQYTD